MLHYYLGSCAQCLGSSRCPRSPRLPTGVGTIRRFARLNPPARRARLRLRLPRQAPLNFRPVAPALPVLLPEPGHLRLRAPPHGRRPLKVVPGQVVCELNVSHWRERRSRGDEPRSERCSCGAQHTVSWGPGGVPGGVPGQCVPQVQALSCAVCPEPHLAPGNTTGRVQNSPPPAISRLEQLSSASGGVGVR